MFSAALALLKWLGPIFFESLFKEKSFLGWISNNLKLCTWIVLWVVLLLAVFQLTDLVASATRDKIELKYALEKANRKQTQTLRDLTYAQLMEKSLAQELYWSRKNLIIRPTLPKIKPSTHPTHRHKPVHLNLQLPLKNGKLRDIKHDDNSVLIKALERWDRDHPPF